MPRAVLALARGAAAHALVSHHAGRHPGRPRFAEVRGRLGTAADTARALLIISQDSVHKRQPDSGLRQGLCKICHAQSLGHFHIGANGSLVVKAAVVHKLLVKTRLLFICVCPNRRRLASSRVYRGPMSRINHRPVVAHLRQQAAAEDWSAWRLAARIAHECQVSLLQAQRLARGWTLRQATSAYVVAGGRLTMQQLSAWEVGRGRPGDVNLDGLCRLYETRPDRLGYGRDYTPAGHQGDGETPSAVPRRSSTGDVPKEISDRRAILRGLFASAGVSLTGTVLDALGDVRRSLTDTLGESLSETMMEQWERSAAEHGHSYQMSPPNQLLAESVLDFVEIQHHLARRQSTEYRRRLCHVTAQLAGTAGMALVALGEHREARAWFRTAQLAAEETGDRALRAWLLAREAVIPFYFGSPQAAAELAERARLVAGSSACATAAWAPALEARSLARVGRTDDARQAMHIAERAFARLSDDQKADTAYGYTERQLRWHIGSMHTVLGDTRRAQHALDQALTMYAPVEHLDRALIALDQAAGLIRVGEVATAAQVGVHTLESLPTAHRTGIVISRAREVAAAIPARAARMPLVGELRDAITNAAVPAHAG